MRRGRRCRGGAAAAGSTDARAVPLLCRAPLFPLPCSAGEVYRPGTWVTGVRGHGLHPNRLDHGVGEVQGTDPLVGKVDAQNPILVGFWAQSDPLAGEGFGDVERATAI